MADQSKRVTNLGAFPLPVEVTPFGWEITLRRIAALGCTPRLRLRDNRPFLSDNANYVIDASFGAIPDPVDLDRTLKLLPGVVETGLFTGMTDLVVVGYDDRTELLTRA